VDVEDFGQGLTQRLDQRQQDATATAAGSLMSATGTNPDAHAKAIDTAEKLNIPPASAAADPAFQFGLELQQRLEALDKAPKTKAFVADPDVAKVAQDDILKLAGIEDMMIQGPADYGNADLTKKPVEYGQSIGAGVVGGFAGTSLSGAGELYNAVGRSLARPIHSGLQAIGLGGVDEALSSPLPWFVSPGEILRRPGTVLKDVAEGMRPEKDRRGLDTDIAEGVGQLAGQIATAIFTGGLASTASLTTMFAQGSDSQAERADKAGARPVDKDTAVIAGGYITYLTEKYGIEAMLNKVPEALKGGIKKALADVLVAGGKEAAQEVVEGVLQNMTALALYEPNAKIFEGWERDAETAFGAAAIVRGVLQAVVKGKSIRSQIRQGEQAQADSDFMDRLAAGAVDSKLAARSPNVFERFMAHQADGSPVTDVYIPADKVREYAQSKAQDPTFNLEDDPLLSLPSVQAQLAEAEVNGHDIVVPVGEYVSKVARSDLHQMLKADIRIRLDGMSMREAVEARDQFDELMTKTGQDAQAEIARVSKEGEPVVQVYDDIFSKLRQAGYGVDASRQYAAVIASRYSTRGARMGSDAWTQYTRMPISIENVAPESLKRISVDPQLDSLIEAARQGVKAPSAGRMFGRSLGEFLAGKGGVVDEGGEFAAMDVSTWQKPRVGTGKLVNPAGMKLDDAALAAMDAGYFPDLQGERPTPDHVIEAVREEIAGKPRYAEGHIDTTEADWANTATELRDTLDSMGHDIREMTNDQVKEVMAAASQARGEGGREYGQVTKVENLTPEQLDAFDRHLQTRADADDIRSRLDAHKGTPWANQAYWAGISRQWVDDVLAGKDPSYGSAYTNPRLKIGERIKQQGDAAIWTYLEGGSILSHPSKPLNSVQSSMLDCDPSIDCAKFCYASQGNYTYDNVVASSELNAWAIEKDPVRAARTTATHYKATAEFHAQKALRLFDKGDGNDNWIPYVEELNRQGVRVQIFSKKPEFLAKVSDFNLRMLSIDESNVSKAEGNDLPIAFVYGGQKDLPALEKYADRIAVILPIKIGRKVMGKEEITPIPKDLMKRICPVDGFGKKIGKIGNEWNCTKCDKNGGIGCFHSSATAKMLEAASKDITDGDELLRTLTDLQQAAGLLTDPAARGKLRDKLALLLSAVRSGADLAEEEGVGGRLREADQREGDRRGDLDGRSFDQAAYHGSPHIFDRFSLDHIGSGEGNQSYGWGLYFAGNKAVARWYRETLSNRKTRSLSDEMDDITIGGKPVLERFAIEADREFADAAKMSDHMGAARRAQEKLDRWTELSADESYPFPDYAKSHAAAWDGVLDALEDGDEIKSKANGRLYKVEIPDDGDYLLWDKPLSEQPEHIYEALKRVLNSEAFADEREMSWGARDAVIEPVNFEDPKDLYNFMWEQLGSDKAASLALRDAGIPGLKYLDGSSRSAGDGSYNYVIFDDNLVSIREYEQTKRGSISFQNGQALIRIFKDRDLSTMLHETSHLWLEELVQDAAMLDAPQQVRDDLQKVLDWFGVKIDVTKGDFMPDIVLGAITTDMHEQWARAGEGYFMEGKAPSTALQSAFENFKAWLIRIYQTLSNLHTPINDDIRGVFDRLIATDSEITAAREKQRLTQAFADAAQGGMTDAEFAAYEKAVAEAKDIANTTMIQKAMAQVRQRREQEWKSEAAEVKTEVEDRMSKEPVWRALRFLRKGADEGSMLAALDGHHLSRDAIVAMYGQDQALKLLPFGVYRNEGGISPHDLAPLLGFDTASDMMQALMDNEAARKQLAEQGVKTGLWRHLVGQEVERVMTDRHGDMLKDGSIEAEAVDAIHNEKQGQVLAAELRALHRQATRVKHQGQTWNIGPLTTVEIAAEWARRTVAAKKVGEIATPAALTTLLRAEARAGKLAQDAILKGDYTEAYRQKQRQILNHALYREAKRVADQVDRDVKMLSKLAKKPTVDGMDQGYLDQIHGLLERYEFKKVGERALQKREALAAFVAKKEAEGDTVIIPAKMLQETQRQNFKRLTVDELSELADTVRNFAALGRLKQELLDKGERRRMDDLVEELAQQTAEMKRRDAPTRRNSERHWKDRLGKRLRGIDASLMKVEQLVDWVDGGSINGVLSRIVFRPIREAQAKASDMQLAVTKRVVEAFEKMTDTQRKSLETEFRVPEFGMRPLMTKSEIIAIALNTGNESNLDKLIRGEKLTGPEEVNAVLGRHMTTADWHLVQDIWDAIESMWPEVAAQHKRLTGLDLPKIQPRTFEVKTNEGNVVQMRGGYYPVVYDPELSPDVEANMQRGDIGLFENIFSRPATSKGHTIERVQGYARPLLLDLRVIPDHLAQVIHRLAFEEVLGQADRFLADPRVRNILAGDGVLDYGILGPEYYKQMRPWLQAIANDKTSDARGPKTPWDRIMRTTRLHATMVGMGFRASTMIAQIGGLSASQEYLGGKWMLTGLKAYMSDPSGMTEFVWSMSGEMKHRANQVDRDLRDNMNDLIGKTDMLSGARRFAFAGIGWMDRHVAVSTWLGAYNKGLADGLTDTDAAASADRAVALTQGAGGVKDLAAIQRESEAFKLYTVFYSYFSVMYARQRNLARGVMDGDIGVPEALAKSWWLMIFPAVAVDFLLGRWPDDDEDETWLGWATTKILTYPLASIPLVRDAAGALSSGFKFQSSPLGQMVDTVFKAGQNIKDLAAGDEPTNVVRNSLNSLGYILGLPTGQAATTLQYVDDVRSGEKQVDNPLEFLWKAAMGGK
jgi:hypothetical protein